MRVGDSSRRCEEIVKNLECDYYYYYIMQHVVCNVVRRDSSVINFDKHVAEIAFFLAAYYWLKPFTDGEGEKAGVHGEKPRL